MQIRPSGCLNSDIHEVYATCYNKLSIVDSGVGSLKANN